MNPEMIVNWIAFILAEGIFSVIIFGLAYTWGITRSTGSGK